MEKQPVIVFDEVQRTPDAEQEIRARIEKLEEIYDRIIGCRVAVKPINQQETGTLHDVHIRIEVPGYDVIVGGGSELNHAAPDVHMAIGEAFDVAERQLREHVERLRGDVKRREEMKRGEVVKLVQKEYPDEEESYGFIATPDAREIYFHHNAVADDSYDRLSEGTLVEFREGEGIKGPKASFVRIVS